MELMLMKDDLWSTVKDDKPAQADITSAWTRKDEKARVAIGLALEDSQLHHVMEAESAKEMWDTLKNYHERGSLSNKISILRRLCTMRLEEGGNMSVHLMEASELVHRLARLGESLKEHLVMAILLSSLPESYNPLVTALEGRPEEDLKLEYVKGKLLDDWRRRNEDRKQEEHKAMLSTAVCNERRNAERVCFYCKQVGHFRWCCPVLLKKRQAREKYEENSMPTQHPESSSSNREVCFTMTTAGSDALTERDWIIDTGCTKHMTGTVGSFINKVPWKEKITLADGRIVIARGNGQGKIVGRGKEGEIVDMKLKELLYVPGLCRNVLSISRITEEGYEVLFGTKDCRIMEGNKVIAVGKKSGGLYYLKQ